MVSALSVEDMKEIELEIMDEIDRVCRENGLNYFLGYGSCLGAIRHGGFIPWDDDMDIIMMREDYERFYEIFETSKSSDRFKLISYRDKSSPQVFFKVVDQSTQVEERYMRAEYGSGVWVDITPLDRVDDTVKAQAGRIKRNLALRYLAITKPKVGGSRLIRLAKRMVCPFVNRIGPYGFARKADELASSASSDDGAGIVADFIGGYDFDDTFPADMFEPLEVPFENRQYFVPKEYDRYLETIYGDWRTPPPEGSRECHTVEAYRL